MALSDTHSLKYPVSNIMEPEFNIIKHSQPFITLCIIQRLHHVLFTLQLLTHQHLRHMFKRNRNPSLPNLPLCMPQPRLRSQKLLNQHLLPQHLSPLRLHHECQPVLLECRVPLGWGPWECHQWGCHTWEWGWV